jgi:hypothetical protein
MRPYSHIHIVYVQDQTSAVLGEDEADPGEDEEGLATSLFKNHLITTKMRNVPVAFSKGKACDSCIVSKQSPGLSKGEDCVSCSLVESHLM